MCEIPKEGRMNADRKQEGKCKTNKRSVKSPKVMDREQRKHLTWKGSKTLITTGFLFISFSTYSYRVTIQS